MRVGIVAVVVGWAVVAHAAPAAKPVRPAPVDPAVTRATDDDWTRATEAWRAAAQAPSAETWQAAALAFDAVVIANRVDAAVRVECAHAAALAWRESLMATPPTIDRSPHPSPDLGDARVPTPRPIAARDQAPLASWGRYLELAAAGAPDATELRFLRGNVLRRFDHLDEAEADFAAVVADPAAGDLALYAANLWLDSLNRQERYDELVALATRLHGDAALMKRFPDLASTVERIRYQARRLDAERAEQAAEHGDPDGYARCAAAYASLYDDAPTADRADEVLYNEAVCAEKAGDPARARDRLAHLAATVPRSPLAGKALFRGAMLALATGDIAGAAPGLEAYASRYPGEKDAFDALADAVMVRIGLGELATAERDVDALAKLRAPSWADDTIAQARLAIARAWADAGNRARAVRAMPRDRDLRGKDIRVRVAPLAWELACPVATTDGLCLRGERLIARAPRIEAALRALLYESLADSREAIRIDTAIITERALAIVHSGAALDEAVASADRALHALAAAPEASADDALFADAAQGHLALHVARVTGGGTDGARAAFEACRDRAIATEMPTPWLRSCEAQLAALGEPPPPMHERVPAARAPVPPPELESGPMERRASP